MQVVRAGKYAIGIVSALVGAALWGFNGNCMQLLFAAYDIPVLFVTAFRMFLAGLVFVAVLLVACRPLMCELLGDACSLLRVCVFGLVGLFFCQLTYMLAIDATNAGTATVLQSFNVVVVLVYTCVRARRAPVMSECLAVVLALVATVLIATKGDLTALSIPAMGLVWGLVSAVAVAFYVCYPKSLFERWGVPAVTALGMLVGGIAAVLCLLVREVGLSEADAFAWVACIDATCIVLLLVVALVGTLASFGLYLYGVSVVGSVRGSLLGTVEPAAATIISAVWLGTVFSWADWLGMVLMIATVFFVSLQPRRP